ncbi:MAG: 3-beta hydroxysteroid dehydrogenase [Rhodobacterales bacterium]|nr:MAG: 3-beta hydroxysteroid dehydrogenase [Rhodobacterales bacterium]
MPEPRNTVLIAGATGYLGRFLVAEYAAAGWNVRALVRNAARAQELEAELFVGEATRPEDLPPAVEGVDLVVSALGITRQRDGLSYRDVDYQANLNLLRAAEAADVARFTYVHVLGAEKMRGVAGIDAKRAFVRALQASKIPETVIAPSGFFSDMEELFRMAQSGRVWLFGDGSTRLNPIHGADLAHALRLATEAGQSWRDIGGPDVFTYSV